MVLLHRQLRLLIIPYIGKFHVRIIRVKNFQGIVAVRSIRKVFLTVDGYSKNDREPGIAGCNAVAVRSSRRSGIYLRVKSSRLVSTAKFPPFIVCLHPA